MVGVGDMGDEPLRGPTPIPHPLRGKAAGRRVYLSVGMQGQPVLELVKCDGHSLWVVPERFRNDRDCVLEAVRQNWSCLWSVAEEFRHDREIVRAAVQGSPYALGEVGDEFRRDREIVLLAIETKPEWSFGPFQMASEDLKKDPEVVLAAVSGDGQCLSCMDKRFRCDRTIVLAGVQTYGQGLRYASGGLQSDREIVLAAVKKDTMAWQYASKTLGEDPHILSWVHLSRADRTRRRVRNAINARSIMFYWMEQGAMRAERNRIQRARNGQVDDPLATEK